jgi:hypothetical protein
MPGTSAKAVPKIQNKLTIHFNDLYSGTTMGGLFGSTGEVKF